MYHQFTFFHLLFFYTSSQQDVPPNVMNEIKYVYQLIKDNGQQGDYALQIKFGELIPVSLKNERTVDRL